MSGSGCPDCGTDVPIEAELAQVSVDGHGITTGSRKIRRCGICSRILPSVEAVTAAPRGGEQQAKAPTEKPKEPTPRSEPKPATMAQRVQAGAPKQLTPAGIVRQARAELKATRAELRKLLREVKRLEKSEKELARLVDAADGKPRSVVRELRRSSG